MPNRPSSLPNRAGLGLKPQHYATIHSERPDVGFFEVHAENYMMAGGPAHRHLTAIAEQYPLSLHGVGLSIGAARPLDRDHLERLRVLEQRYAPLAVSEHLAWSSHDIGFLNDLLPLPYTAETLARVVEHVDTVQTVLGRPILLENPSTYVLFEASDVDEIDFLTQVARRSGCGLLLDVNNVMVSCTNHRVDPYAYIDRFPLPLIGEIHLGGYDEAVDGRGERFLIDAHGSETRPDVFALYEHVIALAGPRPTLIEWDNDVPDFPVLYAEAARVDDVLARGFLNLRRAS
ncbi:MNIO family bufferin maturase [Oryzibacter oryziterrae]|uniref:MNIO family bufferin maturase n=1 Tax=Oryzibacter oryziterrae TaxID=2766474 RepID=UPI001F48D9E3|nr:DUF692 domain-containing protein [Oryzibacter oryziterrae]